MYPSQEKNDICITTTPSGSEGLPVCLFVCFFVCFFELREFSNIALERSEPGYT